MYVCIVHAYNVYLQEKNTNDMNVSESCKIKSYRVKFNRTQKISQNMTGNYGRRFLIQYIISKYPNNFEGYGFFKNGICHIDCQVKASRNIVLFVSDHN